MIAILYKITNIVNNKVYIGQTLTTFRRRTKRHISQLKGNKHANN